MNYYNEFDPKAAAWLRELILAGLLPKGEVDERSICDIKPSDLAGFRQCHFFAGIGGWSLALQLAGWTADRPVWTGSCPCQPFSSAGKHKGTADERHLWPVFVRLIAQCRPPVVFGEQVASAIAHGWLDGVRADMEAEGYAVGGVVLGAHSVGAPHLRQRLYWVGDTIGVGQQTPRDTGTLGEEIRAFQREAFGTADGGYAWSDSVAILCRDGKYRRVPAKSVLQRVADGVPSPVVDMRPESGFPLCAKIPGRVILLKGYGNAIVPQVAAEFIRAYLGGDA